MFSFISIMNLPTLKLDSIKVALLLLFTLFCLLQSGASWAALNCTFRSKAVKFGVYDPLLPSPTTSTGTLTFTCKNATSDVTYTITLSTGGSGTYVTRTMSDGANSLDYNLYTDPTLATVWGDGSSFSSALVSGTITAAQALAGVTFYVYGSIPSQQNAIPGAYSDSITATVSF